MRRHALPRGTTYIEAVAAIALVGLAVLVSAGLLVRGRAVASDLEERRAAIEALASETALLDATPLPQPGAHPWRSGADTSPLLPEAAARVSISPVEGEPSLRRVRVEIRWGSGRHAAREWIALATGGATARRGGAP